MRIVLDVKESLERNANHFFDLAKQSKRKAEGAKKAYHISIAKRQKEESIGQRSIERVVIRKKQWYEKFRWFKTTDGFLVIGGRDATSNEIVIKKHADPGDIVLHTEMAGSPFVVIKSDGKPVSRDAIEEAAAFTAAISRAWKLKLGTAEVFYVRPDQVAKTARHGEYVAKGAFVITGETSHMKPAIAFAIGSCEGTVMGGPPRAIFKHCRYHAEIEQGDEKSSDVAKALKKIFHVPLDEIIAALPPGGVKLARRR